MLEISDATATVIATGLGPIAAVLITLWHQDRSQKRSAKERLFLTLMAHRKSFPISRDWAQGLNLIDVVFSDDPTVLTAWHEFYDYIHIKPMDQKQFEHKHLDLLTRMAKALGYPNLQQTDIDKFYNPQVHGDEATRNYEIQTELLRVLKGQQALSITVPQAAPRPGP